jgi:hypothetical protein
MASRLQEHSAYGHALQSAAARRLTLEDFGNRHGSLLMVQSWTTKGMP